jgi:hypothetical protein
MIFLASDMLVGYTAVFNGYAAKSFAGGDSRQGIVRLSSVEAISNLHPSFNVDEEKLSS